MRRLVYLWPLLAALVSALASPARAPICTGDVILESQAAVDAFDCTEVTGSLDIESVGPVDPIDDLTPLKSLTSVAESLFIEGNPALTTLADLEGLTSVGGDLSIEENPALRECSCGLGGLISESAFTGVGHEVTIQDNASGGTCNAPEQVLTTPCEQG